MKHGIGKTDTGKTRTRSEDSIFVENKAVNPLKNLYILADGMGGHNAGDVASKSAVKFLCEYLQNNTSHIYIQDLLADALRYANEKVHLKSNEDSELRGMGTTLIVCCYDENNFYFAHVGDSRLYVMKDNSEIEQITRDHSLVNEMVVRGMITKEEARNHPQRNVVTRAVGTDYAVAIDKGYRPLENIRNILICSDGLTDMVTDEEIADIMNSGADADNILNDLINAANENGGLDNISVILIEK
ncbi:MAG: Stp1/IreP family PP2C-type Ser/Thr phosphatase [Defluviitaleaceae bacterium]|nr:Stp1/IreP family PP2C-type Ser/Thr phosphatase [Defluviitaleaceae bacterium]